MTHVRRAKQLRVSELYIYGAGGHGAVVAEVAAAIGHKVVGFVDDDPELAGTAVLRWEVVGGSGQIPRRQ